MKVIWKGGLLDVTPQGVQGMLLFCKVPGGGGVMAFNEHMAADKADFWNHWNRLGGAKQDMRWPDGEPVVPEQQGRPLTNPESNG